MQTQAPSLVSPLAQILVAPASRRLSGGHPARPRGQDAPEPAGKMPALQEPLRDGGGFSVHFVPRGSWRSGKRRQGKRVWRQRQSRRRSAGRENFAEENPVTHGTCRSANRFQLTPLVEREHFAQIVDGSHVTRLTPRRISLRPLRALRL